MQRRLNEAHTAELIDELAEAAAVEAEADSSWPGLLAELGAGGGA